MCIHFSFNLDSVWGINSAVCVYVWRPHCGREKHDKTYKTRFSHSSDYLTCPVRELCGEICGDRTFISLNGQWYSAAKRLNRVTQPSKPVSDSIFILCTN